jgi:PhnB protein
MPVKALTPYVFFSGRCEEAINFYRHAIGAEVIFLMHHNDSPDPPPPGMLQEGFENKVMHATLKIGGATLFASDGCDDKTPVQGFNLSLALETEEEVKQAYQALADGGESSMPPMKTFWSPCFGMLKDKFGISWMVTVHDEQHA